VCEEAARDGDTVLRDAELRVGAVCEGLLPRWLAGRTMYSGPAVCGLSDDLPFFCVFFGLLVFVDNYVSPTVDLTIFITSYHVTVKEANRKGKAAWFCLVSADTLHAHRVPYTSKKQTESAIANPSAFFIFLSFLYIAAVQPTKEGVQ